MLLVIRVMGSTHYHNSLANRSGAEDTYWLTHITVMRYIDVHRKDGKTK
jgi:hypothetical protein